MTVFKSLKVLNFTLLFATIHLVAIAKSPIGERINDPIEGIERDSLEGVLQDFTRLHDKIFAVNKNTTVVLSNKYGTIDVHTNNGSKVIVKVKVTVNATSQTQAEKVFERINIAFSDGPEFVKTETTVENQPKNSIIFTGTNTVTNCDFRIDYDVTMPAGNRLDLTNRHGNTTIAALKTSVKIDQKYGDFRLDGATSATIVLAYGGGQLSDLNTLYGTVSYGKLTSPNIRNAYLKTIYSQLRFDQIGAMDIQSNYDTYDINDVATLKAPANSGQ